MRLITKIMLTSHKKSIAMVSMEDLEVLKALENAHDIHEAKLVLREIKDKGSLCFEEMKKRNGLTHAHYQH